MAIFEGRGFKVLKVLKVFKVFRDFYAVLKLLFCVKKNGGGGNILPEFGL